MKNRLFNKPFFYISIAALAIVLITFVSVFFQLNLVSYILFGALAIYCLVCSGFILINDGLVGLLIISSLIIGGYFSATILLAIIIPEQLINSYVNEYTFYSLLGSSLFCSFYGLFKSSAFIFEQKRNELNIAPKKRKIVFGIEIFFEILSPINIVLAIINYNGVITKIICCLLLLNFVFIGFIYSYLDIRHGPFYYLAWIVGSYVVGAILATMNMQQYLTSLIILSNSILYLFVPISYQVNYFEHIITFNDNFEE